MTEAEQVDVAVIGGGVIGLAVARTLARAGRQVLLLEAERVTGSHASSRNSEVIHAGIYYAPGSLKARLCVQGKAALYAYCQERKIAHQRLGKLIVAARDEEVPVLDALRVQAAANGVDDLLPLTAAEIRELEPAVRAVAGLFSPSTGIVDSHGLMAALRSEASSLGVSIAVAAPVLGGRVLEDGIELDVGGAAPMRLCCAAVVNAAGLWAPQVARAIQGLPAETIPTPYFAKGHYFTLRGPSPFRHLVYPVPVVGGLGTHVTLDLGGRARFGPDVVFTRDVSYAFEEERSGSFYASIRAYYPALADGALVPGYTGIRPKLGPPGSPAADFVIQKSPAPGLVNLYGIESPGLTASLAIAERVAGELGISLPG